MNPCKNASLKLCKNFRKILWHNSRRNSGGLRGVLGAPRRASGCVRAFTGASPLFQGGLKVFYGKYQEVSEAFRKSKVGFRGVFWSHKDDSDVIEGSQRRCRGPQGCFRGPQRVSWSLRGVSGDPKRF